jgi:acetylornithine deacetylase
MPLTDVEQSVCEAIEARRDELVSLATTLIGFDTTARNVGDPPRDESAMQEYLAAVLRESGASVDVWEPDAGAMAGKALVPPGLDFVGRPQLIARRAGAGGGRSLYFGGHIDVVSVAPRESWTSDPFAAQVRGGKLYGRGACDMKGGLVAAIWAVRALQHAGLELGGDLLLASVEGEEDGGLGSYALLRRGWRADACVIPEPTGLDLVPANAGALTFRLRVRGHATHASRRTEGESALEHFWPVWQALQGLEAERNADVDPLLRRWPMPYALSIGTVRCGDWASSVPDLLVAEGRLGVALDESPAQARSAFELAVARASGDDPWLREHPVEVDWWGGQFAPGRLPADSDLLERMRSAHALAKFVLNGPDARQAEVWGAPYGSDLRLLTGLGGIPTLHYGPGDAGLAHGPNESVPLAEVELAARALALLALDVSSAE